MGVRVGREDYLTDLKTAADAVAARSAAQARANTSRHPIAVIRDGLAYLQANGKANAAMRKLEELDDFTEDIAQEVLYAAYTELRSGGDFATTRNPYHWDSLTSIDQLAKETSDAASKTGSLSIIAEKFGRADPLSIPRLARRLTPAAAKAHIALRVVERYLISQDQQFLEFETRPGVWTIQHQASGLRADFQEVPAGPRRLGRFGRVLSKYEFVPDIRPAGWQSPEKEREYLGLGIGERIYRRAADRFPAVRWERGDATPHAAGLRKKLHIQDPYIWEDSSCARCDAAFAHRPHLSWASLPLLAFPPH